MVNNYNNKKTLLWHHCVPETLHKPIHLISKTLLGGYYYYSHFPKEETED